MGSHTKCVGWLCTTLELISKSIEIEMTMRVTGDDAGVLLLLQQAIPYILHFNFSRCFCSNVLTILLGTPNCRISF